MIPSRLTASGVSQLDQDAAKDLGLFAEIGDFFRQFIIAAFDPYRPEQHYMRGPGPACRARQRSSS